MSESFGSSGAHAGGQADFWSAYLHESGIPGVWPEQIAEVLGPRVLDHAMTVSDGVVSADYAAQIVNEGNQINRTVPVDLSNPENVRDGTDLAHNVAIACNVGEQLLTAYKAAGEAAQSDADFHAALAVASIASKPVRTIGKTMANCREERAKNTKLIVSQVESLLDERREDVTQDTLLPETAAYEDSALLPLTPAAVQPRGNWRDETQYVGFETDEPVHDPALAVQMALYAGDLEEARQTLGHQLHKSLEFVRAAEAASEHLDLVYSFTGRLAVQVHQAITNLAAQDAFYLESAMDVVSEELGKRYELAQLDYSFGVDNSAQHREADVLLQALVTPGEYYAD